MLALRKEFSIPIQGYQTISELENFKQVLHKQSLELLNTDTTDELKDISSEHLPEIKFQKKIHELVLLVGVNTSFKSFVELCVICPLRPPDALLLQQQGALRLQSPLVAAQGYRTAWLGMREHGVAVEIKRKLTKEEWNNLKDEVNAMLVDDGVDEVRIRVRPNAQADFQAFYALRQREDFYDAYDAVYDAANTISIDKNKKDTLRKRISRTKNRGKRPRT